MKMPVAIVCALLGASLPAPALGAGGLPEPLRVDTTNVDSIGIYELYFEAWTNMEGADRRLRKFSPERSEAPVLARHFNYTLMAELLDREILDDSHVILGFHGYTDRANIIIPPNSRVEIRRKGQTWEGELFCIRYVRGGDYVIPSIEFPIGNVGLSLAPVRSTEFDLIKGRIVPSGTLYGLGEVMGAVPFWVRLREKSHSGAAWKRDGKTPMRFWIVSEKEGGSL